MAIKTKYLNYSSFLAVHNKMLKKYFMSILVCLTKCEYNELLVIK